MVAYTNNQELFIMTAVYSNSQIVSIQSQYTA